MCKADGVNWHANETRAASRQSWSHINTHTRVYTVTGYPYAHLMGASPPPHPPHEEAQPSHPSTYPHTNNNTFVSFNSKYFSINNERFVGGQMVDWLTCDLTVGDACVIKDTTFRNNNYNADWYLSIKVKSLTLLWRPKSVRNKIVRSNTKMRIKLCRPNLNLIKSPKRIILRMTSQDHWVYYLFYVNP